MAIARSTTAISPLAGSQTHLYSVRLDGTGTIELEPSGAEALFAGAVGGRVVYLRPTSAGDSDLYAVNADGSAPAALAVSNDAESFAGSSGGLVLFYRDDRSGGSIVSIPDLYAVGTDGSGLVALANGPVRFKASAGGRIVYSPFVYEPGGGGPPDATREIGVSSVKTDGSATAVLANAPDGFAGSDSEHVYIYRPAANGAVDRHPVAPAGGPLTLLATGALSRLEATFAY